MESRLPPTIYNDYYRSQTLKLIKKHECGHINIYFKTAIAFIFLLVYPFFLPPGSDVWVLQRYVVTDTQPFPDSEPDSIRHPLFAFQCHIKRKVSPFCWNTFFFTVSRQAVVTAHLHI